MKKMNVFKLAFFTMLVIVSLAGCVRSTVRPVTPYPPVPVGPVIETEEILYAGPAPAYQAAYAAPVPAYQATYASQAPVYQTPVYQAPASVDPLFSASASAGVGTPIVSASAGVSAKSY